jgi:predicted dehydrogenase
LVVCAVRVDRHYETIVPSIKAGKNVFVEWPLGKNLRQAQELLALTKEFDVKATAIGLQARFDPSVETLKAILAEGRIGKVLSSTVVSQGGGVGSTVSEGIAYFLDREIGGNLLTIAASHCLDYVQEGSPSP